MFTSMSYRLGSIAGIAFVCLFCSVSCAQTQLKELRLIPWPAEIEARDGDFTPAGELVIAIVENDAVSKEIAETLAEDLKALKFKATVKAGDAPKGAVSIKIIEDESMGSEAYRLEIADIGISIIASGGDGLFWGTRTALQLLAAGPNKSVPCLSIKDKPQFTYRALLIDPARSFHTMNFLLETVKNLSAYKMNRLQIHFCDNEGYRLPSKKFPKLPSVDAEGKPLHYTEKEIAELVATARKYHVTIIPEIEMFAHAGRLTAVLPELRGNPQAPCSEVCIGSKEAAKTLEALMSEVMDMIPGPYFHVGGDEARSASWRDCPTCQKRIADEGLQSLPGLYNFTVNNLNKFVKSKGRQLIVWEAFDPKGDPVYHPHATMEPPAPQETINTKGRTVTVDKDVIVIVADINLRIGTRPMDYLDAGYTIINASWKPLYVVPNMSVASAADLAAWDVFQFKSFHDDGKIGAYPMDKPWVIKPTPRVIGAQMCSWDPVSHQSYLPGWLFNIGPEVANPWHIKPAPRVQIVAERLWTGSVTKPDDLLRRAGVEKEKQ